jgi:tetratricopeptide (TPR) repeat protein/type II secretory pathway predicted ATPase ExeA
VVSEERGQVPKAIEDDERTEPHAGVAPRRDQTVTDTTIPDGQIPDMVRSDTETDNDIGTRRRFQTSDPYSLRGVRSQLVGRNSELAEMQRVTALSAKENKPQLITVLGNQGTGKSRLVDELVQSLPGTTMVYTSRVELDTIRYSTIARLLRDRFTMPEKATETDLLENFRREVQDVFGDLRVAEVLHVLGRFLDLSFPDSPFLRVLTDNPRQYDELSRTVLKRFIEVDAERGPIVLVIDGLQCADDASLALLVELTEGLGDVPITVVVCARPELMVRSAGWGQDIERHLRVELRNLSEEHAESMFRHLLDRCESLPADIVDDAVEMTGGNPHFMDQLVRLFLANGTINSDVTPWRLDASKAVETDLPITVEEAIEARIASLAGSERDVLQKGAVFGNVFWLGSVVALSRLGHAREESAEPAKKPAGPMDYVWSEAGDEIRRSVTKVVNDLVERDYLLRLDDEDSSVAGDIEFVFKHNLERELISNGTDAGRLSRFHRLAAQWIETKSGALSDEQLEFLGQLYEKGGDQRRAANAYIGGGDRARERYSNEQAVELYRHGLELLEEDDTVVLLDALHNLGSVLDLVGKTAEAQVQFTRMLRQAWLFDHRSKGGAAHNRLARIHRRLAEYDLAMAHFKAAHELFNEASDKRGIAGTLDDIGQVHWLRGGYPKALEFHRQALTIRREIGDPRSIALSLANIGRVHQGTGAFSAASRHFNEALELRRSIGDRAGVIQSLCDLGGVQVADGAQAKAALVYEEAKKIAGEIGDRLALADVLAGQGKCFSAIGKYSDAIEVLLEGKAIAQSLGHRLGASECHRRLAETFLMIGDSVQATDNAKQALSLGKRVGSPLHVGSAYRVMAEATFSKDRSPETLQVADEQFRKAVEILAEMKNELELARTYRAYARHRILVGHPDEAKNLRARADEIFDRLRGAADLE